MPSFGRVVIPVIAAVTAGCSVIGALSVPSGTFGLSINDDGTVLVHYPLCDREKVTRVLLVIPPDKEWQDLDEGKPLWDVASKNGMAVSEISVGQAPEGFEENVALSGPLPEKANLEFHIESVTRDGDLSQEMLFTVAELPEEGLYFHGEILTKEEVFSMKTCYSGGVDIGGIAA